MEVTAVLEQMEVKMKSVHKSRKMLRSSIDDICRLLANIRRQTAASRRQIAISRRQNEPLQRDLVA